MSSIALEPCHSLSLYPRNEKIMCNDKGVDYYLRLHGEIGIFSYASSSRLIRKFPSSIP